MFKCGSFNVIDINRPVGEPSRLPAVPPVVPPAPHARLASCGIGEAGTRHKAQECVWGGMALPHTVVCGGGFASHGGPAAACAPLLPQA